MLEVWPLLEGDYSPQMSSVVEWANVNIQFYFMVLDGFAGCPGWAQMTFLGL